MEDIAEFKKARAKFDRDFEEAEMAFKKRITSKSSRDFL
jgi:hypothetical protein